MTGEGLNLPSIGRTADDIQKVGDYQTLVPGAEVKGRFFCEACGADLTSLARSVLNDGGEHVRRCPNAKCPRLHFFNAGWLAAKVMEARLRENSGLGPRVATGGIREEVQPSGRKLVIACPGPASIQARAPEVRK